MKNKNIFKIIDNIQLNKETKFIKLSQSESNDTKSSSELSDMMSNSIVSNESNIDLNINSNNLINEQEKSAKRPNAELKKNIYSSMQEIVANYPAIYSNLRVIARKATEEFYMNWQQSIMSGSGPLYTLLRQYYLDVNERLRKLEDFANKEYNEKLRAFRKIDLSINGSKQPFIVMDGDFKQSLNYILSGSGAYGIGAEAADRLGLSGIAGGGQLIGGGTIASQEQLLLGPGGPNLFDVDTAASLLLRTDQSLRFDKPERNKYGIELLDKMFDTWLQSFWAIYDSEFMVMDIKEMAGINTLGGVGPYGFNNPSENFMQIVDNNDQTKIYNTNAPNESTDKMNLEGTEELTVASLATKYLKNKIFKISQENVSNVLPVSPTPEELSNNNNNNNIMQSSSIEEVSNTQDITNIKEKIRKLLDIKAGGYDKWINDFLYIPSMQERNKTPTEMIQDGLKVIMEQESDTNLSTGEIIGTGIGGIMHDILPQEIIDAIYYIQQNAGQNATGQVTGNVLT